jgi:oxygen-dependent protoporphyrinogen oxidase
VIAVVGGGISGLSTAWYLAKAGLSCTLIEKNNRLGGVIQTDTWEGCVLEAGPDSFLGIKPEAAQLGRELGIGEELIGSNDDRRATFIWKGNRMIPLPDGMMMMVPTKTAPVVFTPLLSWSTKVRMGLEYFRRPQGPQPERSVSQFIEEHYGLETVDYLAEPLLSGVYGGDPRALSVNAVLPRFVDMETKYGSLTRGALEARKKMGASEGPLFRTFRNGLGSLVRELETQLQGKMRVLSAQVESLDRAADGWRMRAGSEWLEASHVVLATPAHAAAVLLRPHDAELGRLLHNIDYSSSLTIALAFRPNRIPPPVGFGFLVPKKERRVLMAGTWVQNKFPHRAPDGYVVLRCFIGGPGPQPLLDMSDEDILSAVRSDLKRLLGLDAVPDYQRVIRWRRSMAQYTLGHANRVKQIEGRAAALPNLFLAGNAYSGIGVPDCIRTGRLAAEAVAKAIR